jgi:hypothetical protein
MYHRKRLSEPKKPIPLPVVLCYRKIMSETVNAYPRDSDKERRWIVLSPDGRYVTVGRSYDPTEQEINVFEADLSKRGLSGWLAIMEGNPWGRRLPSLMLVRPIAHPNADFAEAAKLCVMEIKKTRASLEAK